ncbi:MAG: PHP domain-containing protein [Candidatus Woesearchaeota archaeon]
MGSVIFKRPPLRKLKKEGLFGVDLHFHTKYSLDAVSRIPTAIKKAEKKGFGFAITDHNTVKGVISSYRLRKHALIIPGIEVTCKNGNHILAYFYAHTELEEFFEKMIKPHLKKNPFFTDLSLSEVIDSTTDYNCVTCAPHPFAPGAVSMKNTGVSKVIEKKLDAIEVLNGYNLRQRNMKAIYWASKLNKGVTGGSDGHSTFELGNVLTLTHSTDIDNIFNEIKRNKAMVMGREENMVLKAMNTVSKGGTYINNCKKRHITKKLITSQFGVEYNYFRKRFSNNKVKKFLEEHKKEFAKEGE